jgi:hypothetical protein
MIRWDYLTVTIHYDHKRHKDWVLQRDDGSITVGLGQALSAPGAAGWELVSLTVDGFRVFPTFGSWNMEPTEYRATFKRPQAGGME